MPNQQQRPHFRLRGLPAIALAALLAQSAFLSGAGSPLSGPLTHYPGNPLLKNGPEPYDAGKTGPRVVIKAGPGRYKMWYEAVAGDGRTSVAYATSTDGLKWSKRGVTMPPSVAWEMEEVSPNSVLIEGGVYKLWYHGGGYVRGKKRLGHARIGYATSKDGLTWTKYPGNPVLDIGPAGSFDDNQVAEPRVLRIGKTYRMYFTGQKGTEVETSLGMATSADGIHWQKNEANPILNKTQWGGWGGAFFPEKGIWHLWHTSPGKPGLAYMWSSDGIHWTNGPNNPVLTPNSDKNAPDGGYVGDSVSGYRDDATYRIMYTGFNSNLFGKLGRFEGICLATIEGKPDPSK